MRLKLLVLISTALLLSGSPATAAPGEDIGAAVKIVNLVTAEYETDQRRLAQGDNVRQDELIEVGTDGTGEIRLRDNTQLALGPGSRLLLDEFVYKPDISGGAIVLNLVRGSFRFITGIAAKPAYVIRTPSAAITVRGTIFDVYVQTSGMSWLLLIEGAIEVCNERGDCGLHDEPGKLIRITPDGDVGNPVKWASLQKDGQPFEAAFPFVVAPPSFESDPVFTPEDIVGGDVPDVRDGSNGDTEEANEGTDTAPPTTPPSQRHRPRRHHRFIAGSAGSRFRRAGREGLAGEAAPTRRSRHLLRAPGGAALRRSRHSHRSRCAQAASSSC